MQSSQFHSESDIDSNNITSVPSAFVSVSASPTGTAAVGPALYHGSPLSGDLGCFKDGYHSLPWNKDGRNWIEQPYQYSLCLYSARAANAPFFGLRTPFCYYGTFDLRTLGASDQCSYTSQTADGVSGVGSYPGDPSGSTIYQDGWIRLFNTSQAQDLDLITTPTPTLTPTPTPTLPPVPTIQPNPSSCGIKRGDKVWTGYAAHVFQTKADCEIVTSGTSETCQETSFIPYGSATNYDSCGLETGDQVGIGCWLVYQTYSDYLLQCNNGGGAGTWVAAGDGPYIRYQLDRTPKKSSNPNTCGIKRGDLVWTGYAAHVFQTKADCEIVTNGTLETCQETRFIPHGSVTDYNSCGLQTGDKVGIGCWLVYQTYQDYWDQCRNGGGAGTWVGAGDGAYIRYQLAHLPKITSNPNTCNITHVYTGYAAHVFQRLADCDRVTAPYVLKTNERCSKTPLVPHEGNTCGLLTGDETGIGCWYAYQTYDDYWNQCRNGGGKGTWVGRGDGAYIQAKINGKPTGSAAYINSIDSASTLGVADTTCTSSPSSISPAIIGGVVGAMVVVMILSHIAHYQVQKRRQQNSVKSITVPMEYTNNPITTQV